MGLLTPHSERVTRLSRMWRRSSSPVLRMGWHHLLFLHWTIEPEVLRPLIPRELEIDLYQGRAYIGLIPFTMRRVRPRWLPGLPFAPHLYEDFHETNVRTYVRDKEGNSGVWFFSLDAASLPAVVAARGWFHLPYFWSKMNLARVRQCSQSEIEYSIRYQSRRIWPQPHDVGCDISVDVSGETPHCALAGSLEHFLVERYFLFSQNERGLFRGRVRHKPYRLQAARVRQWNENLIVAAGLQKPDGAPHVLYSPEARVEAFPLQIVKP